MRAQVSSRAVLIAGAVILGGAVVGLVTYSILARQGPLVSDVGTFWDQAIADAHKARLRLLQETDLPSLLAAGREILRQVPISEADRRVVGILPTPKGAGRSEVIRRLAPRGLVVSTRGYLQVEMHGGMDHFGVRIYPADFNAPEPSQYFHYGDRELIPGLWYYDDIYRTDRGYDKQVLQWIGKRSGEPNGVGPQAAD
jgi:hypothetical protein